MTTKRAATVKKAAPGPNLTALRGSIDKIDAQLVQLMNERARVAQEIGKLKAADGADVFSAGREAAVLTKIVEANPGPLDQRAVRAIFRELMSGSRALQRALRIAFLGPEYSFSHLAAIEQFGSSVEYVPLANIAAVFEVVNRGHADLGMVPIENSTDGRVADTLDMFLRLPLKICAEVSLRIHQNLLSRSGLGDIQRVYSKWQALSQCRHWLATNRPQATLHEVQSTATAVELAKGESHAAAIASRQASVHYGVAVVQPNIEDRPNNHTRFAVIGHKPADRTGKDKTCIMFETADEAGALHDALGIISKNGVNLTWIESFPAPVDGKTGRYIFFADLAGHLADAPVAAALKALEKKCLRAVSLGSFPRGPSFD